jgi:hypothetical protein
MTESEKPTTDEIRLELLQIERRMGKVGEWNIYERWNSGRVMLELRNPETHYLPNGQLTSLAATLKVSTRELSDRMRVAEAYRTATQFKKAAQACLQVWTCLLRSLPATRDARTGPTKVPKDLRRKAYEALGQLLAYSKPSREERQVAQRLYDMLGGDSE